MKSSFLNRWALGLAVLGAALVLTVAIAAGPPDHEHVNVHKGKIKVVTTDPDGNTHEETFEFDGPRPFLGVRVEQHDDGGVRVDGVVEDSAAERAGIRKGDVIVGFAGHTIETPWSLTSQVLKARPGDRVDVELLRDGVSRTVTVELGQHEGWFGGLKDFRGFDSEAFEEHLERLGEHLEGLDLDFRVPHIGHLGAFGHSRPKLGVELVETTPELREHFGAPADAGVMVGKVMRDMPAERAGIRVGDLIVAADGEPIRGSGDLVHALHDKRGEAIELELIRDGRSLAVEVYIPQPEDDEDVPSGPRA